MRTRHHAVRRKARRALYPRPPRAPTIPGPTPQDLVIGEPVRGARGWGVGKAPCPLPSPLAVSDSPPEQQAGSPATTAPGRPPTFEDYRPPRTTAESGATMLLSGILAAGAVGVLLLAVYTKVADRVIFGQISNLLAMAIALLLLAIYVLVWEIAIRLLSRGDE